MEMCSLFLLGKAALIYSHCSFQLAFTLQYSNTATEIFLGNVEYIVFTQPCMKIHQIYINITKGSLVEKLPIYE